MKDGRQIAAARVLLNWTVDELIKRTGVSRPTISRIENNDGKPNSNTLNKIINALTKEGISFTDTGGVDLIDKRAQYFVGETWFLDILDDIYLTLEKSKNKELLIFGGRNKKSSPEVVEKFRKLREIGVTIKEAVEEDDDYLMGQEENYRWIPKDFFKNHITVIYADKVCNDFHSHGILITDKNWADTERNKFNLIWSLLPELTVRSTSNVRY